MEIDNAKKTDENLGVGDNSENSGASSESNDKVDFKTYRRTVDEVKKLKAELSEKSAAIEKINKEKEAEKRGELLQKGKLEEIVNLLQSEKEQADKRAKQIEDRFKLKAVTSELFSVAKEEGCIDLGFLSRLVEPEDIEAIAVDDNYTVDRESVKAVIAKKKMETKGISLFKPMEQKTPKDANIRQDKEVKGFKGADIAMNPEIRKEYFAQIKQGKMPKLTD